MAICNGCGGVVGRDCFNPQECEWITQDQERYRHEHLEQRVEELERKLKAVENLLSTMAANV